MPRLSSIVFDLDDTLYAEREYVRSGFGAVASWIAPQVGVDEAAAFNGLWELFDRGERGDIFDRWLVGVKANPETHVSNMVRVYREHVPALRLRDGAGSLLERLRGRYRLGLVTDGPLVMQRRKVEALGLDKLVDIVVYSDEGGRHAWKPHPWAFERVLERLGAPANTAAYVADNPIKDFLGARRAGLLSIRVRCEDGLHRSLEPASSEHAPDLEIGSLDELEPLLNMLETGA